MPQAHGKLLWSDEFDGTKLDEEKWRYEPTASMAPPLNDELQRYVAYNDRTVSVGDGVLTITARRDMHEGAGPIVSGRVSTYGKFSFTYGVAAIRMKVPYVRGFWPAGWLLGTNIQEVGWPACGEVDIMEVFGHRRGRHSCSTVHNLLHSWGTRDPLDGGCATLEDQDLSDWHVWWFEWTPERISFRFDDEEEPIFSYKRDSSEGKPAEQYPYSKPFYFILNLAVGGNGPSEPVKMDALDGDGTSLIVDYVRVYALEDEGDGKATVNTAALPGQGWINTAAVLSKKLDEPLSAASVGARAGAFAGLGLAALLLWVVVWWPYRRRALRRDDLGASLLDPS